MSSGIVIPDIAKGYERDYMQFLKLRLIYKPDSSSDVGKVELPIAALTNPLGSTFDTIRCEDSGKYLSFATGYRKGKNPAKEKKLKVWIASRFLIERELATTAKHFRQIIDKRSTREPVEIFFTWGNWDNLDGYDYNVFKEKWGEK